VSGIPHAVLIDANGLVAWEGHPGALEEATLEKAMQGALPRPLWEWTPATKGVKVALQKGAFKSALDQAAKLTPADDGPTILAALQAMVKRRVDDMKAKHALGDFLGAGEAAAELAKRLAGLPEAAEAVGVSAAISANPDAARVMKGQRKIAKLRSAEYSKRKEITAAIDDLRELQKEYAGTYAATEADQVCIQLNDLANGLP